MNESNIDPSKGQFIDPMFAVVIAAAVSETVVTWAKGGALPSGFQACVVALGYINLLLSWFGYHKSISRKPIRGSLRFIITVVLLPLYLLTIILFNNNFLDIALIYGGIFFLWSCWEYFKYIEHGERKSFISLQFRSFNLIAYAAVIYLLGASFVPLNWQQNWFSVNANEIALSIIAFAVISLRVVKSAGKGNTAAARIWEEIKALLFGADESSKT